MHFSAFIRKDAESLIPFTDVNVKVAFLLTLDYKTKYQSSEHDLKPGLPCMEHKSSDHITARDGRICMHITSGSDQLGCSKAVSIALDNVYIGKLVFFNYGSVSTVLFMNIRPEESKSENLLTLTTTSRVIMKAAVPQGKLYMLINMLPAGCIFQLILFLCFKADHFNHFFNQLLPPIFISFLTTLSS